jgi:outer membrane protein assembly factor BamA
MKLLNSKIIFLSAFLLIYLQQIISGQSVRSVPQDNDIIPPKDIIDVFQRVINKHSGKDSGSLKGSGPFFTILPAIGYSLHTGLTGVMATTTSFYTDIERQRISQITINGYYSQFHQYWFTASSNIFLEKQKLILSGDTRYYKFPTQTYGLGAETVSTNPLQIDYSYLRFYQVVFNEIASNLFLGVGYNLDNHWNIKIDSVPGDEQDQFIKYQKGTHSVSSGISLNFLYDSRKNMVNPRNGTFASIQFRPNMKILGSDENWQSLLIDIRHYIKLPASSHNILALWSYNDITLSGTPPYLDLPSIGWDDYSGTGRGYVAGRYTGRNLLYFESEYRFSLTRNGFVGGVVFVNAETVSEDSPDVTHSIIPAGGLGLRIKISKYSDTNLCIDYAFGIEGSHGFSFGMGEVF